MSSSTIGSTDPSPDSKLDNSGPEEPEGDERLATDDGTGDIHAELRKIHLDEGKRFKYPNLRLRRNPCCRYRLRSCWAVSGQQQQTDRECTFQVIIMMSHDDPLNERPSTISRPLFCSKLDAIFVSSWVIRVYMWHRLHVLVLSYDRSTHGLR